VSEDGEQHTYWTIKEENGLLHLLDPEKRLYVYVKWDGMIHVWFYETPVLYNHDTGIEDYGIGSKGHHDYYWMYGDIDEEIARLQSLKEIATKWFADKGEVWPPEWARSKQGGQS
jgi:hypothetical protein